MKDPSIFLTPSSMTLNDFDYYYHFWKISLQLGVQVACDCGANIQSELLTPLDCIHYLDCIVLYCIKYDMMELPMSFRHSFDYIFPTLS
jgi:hypothetical protein